MAGVFPSLPRNLGIPLYSIVKAKGCRFRVSLSNVAFTCGTVLSAHIMELISKVTSSLLAIRKTMFQSNLILLAGKSCDARWTLFVNLQETEWLTYSAQPCFPSDSYYDVWLLCQSNKTKFHKRKLRTTLFYNLIEKQNRFRNSFKTNRLDKTRLKSI